MPVTINGTTGIAGVDGSASTPSVQGSDTNTGIFFPAADTIAFGEGGVEAMRIDSSGNVGIGTTSPAKKLHVNGDIRLGDGGGTGAIFTDATNGLRFMLPAAGTSNTESMRLDSSGNLLVGASSVTGSVAPKLYVSGSAADGTQGVQIINYKPALVLSDISSGYYNYQIATDSGLLTFGYEAGTAGSTNTFTNRMVIDSSGNVGIGTSSPNIGGANTDNAILTLKGKASTRGGIFEMGSFGTTGNDQTLGWNRYFDGSTENASIEVARASSTSTAYMKFSTNGGSGNTERARIDSSGNLLVGTTTAVGKATIAGNLSVAGSDNAIIRSGGNAWLIVSSNTGYGSTGAHLKLDGGGGTWIFNNTTTTFYVASAGIYSTTTASAANMYVDSGNQLYRSTSSLKYKTDVKDATYGLAEVMQLRPVTYKGRNDGDKVFGGLIAEEVDAVGLNEFVQYAEDGSPDALAYGNMVSLLVKAIQELSAKVDAQAAEIVALKAVKT